MSSPSTNRQEGSMWYTHKNLWASSSLLIHAIPHLFSYINDRDIPKTTNELEGYFTHLKEKPALHKGLKFEKRKHFIKWYLYLKKQK